MEETNSSPDPHEQRDMILYQSTKLNSVDNDTRVPLTISDSRLTFNNGLNSKTTSIKISNTSQMYQKKGLAKLVPIAAVYANVMKQERRLNQDHGKSRHKEGFN